MENSDRKLWPIANRIHQELQLFHRSRFNEVTRRVRQFIDIAERLRRADHLLAFSLDRGWPAAAGHMLERIAQELREVPFHGNDALRAIESAKPKLPSVQDILADLRQAEEEFGNFRHEQEGDLLVVTTEAIELQGHYLGEFDIQLRLGSIHELRNHRSTYRVIALDPHPSGRNDSVTHPHVSDECLCEGDAGAAIAAALSSGRICDFFQLVNSVLTTYNPHSPYVSLEDWDGEPCHDCGTVIDADNTFWCHSCEEDFCESCASYCRNCEETTCASCLQTCAACNESICPSCMTTCDDCGRSICRSCRTDNQCPCVQEKENEDESTEKPAEGSPVQAQAA